MTCKQALLYQSGELTPQEQEAFKKHLATCKACQAQISLASATEQSLTAPAAPAEVVDRVLLKTTRRPTVWSRFRTVFVGSVAAMVALAVGVGTYVRHQPVTNAEFVMYMSQTSQNEYATLSNDLDLFEQMY